MGRNKKKKAVHKPSVWNKRVLYAEVIVLVVVVFWLVFMRGEKISVFFDKEENLSGWQVSDNTGLSKTEQGFLLKKRNTNKASGKMIIAGTPENLGNASWDEYPYIRLEVTPQDSERRLALLWLPNGSGKKTFVRRSVIPSDADEILFNVHQDIKWQREFSWTNDTYGSTKIGTVGFSVSGTDQIEIRSLTFLSKLGPFEYAKRIVAEYFLPQNINAHSINFMYGITVLGVSLIFTLGVALCFISGLLAYKKRFSGIFVIGLFLSILLSDIPVKLSLIFSDKDAYTKSAWHGDQRTEYESRFGKRFAELAMAFEEKVPFKSRVGEFRFKAHHINRTRPHCSLESTTRYYPIALFVRGNR